MVVKGHIVYDYRSAKLYGGQLFAGPKGVIINELAAFGKNQSHKIGGFKIGHVVGSHFHLVGNVCSRHRHGALLYNEGGVFGHLAFIAIGHLAEINRAVGLIVIPACGG